LGGDFLPESTHSPMIFGPRQNLGKTMPRITTC
jgi:hypothetical protein